MKSWVVKFDIGAIECGSCQEDDVQPEKIQFLLSSEDITARCGKTIFIWATHERLQDLQQHLGVKILVRSLHKSEMERAIIDKIAPGTSYTANQIGNELTLKFSAEAVKFFGTARIVEEKMLDDQTEHRNVRFSSTVKVLGTEEQQQLCDLEKSVRHMVTTRSIQYIGRGRVEDVTGAFLKYLKECRK